MDIKIFYLSLRNRAKLEKLLMEGASKKKILHQEKLLEKYLLEQLKCMNKIVSTPIREITMFSLFFI